MALPTITVTGRLVDVPELRWTSSGTALAKFRLAANSRKYNRDTQQWEDGDVWFGRATVFGDRAEALAEDGLEKGAEVTIRGRLKTTQWEDKETGAKRSADEVLVDEIARPVRMPRHGQASGHSGTAQSAGDPWAPAGSEPPF